MTSDQTIRWLLKVAGLFSVISWSSISAAGSPVQIDRATQQWLNIERQTNQLQSDWKEQSALLTQRVSILKAEKKQLSTILSKNNNSGNDVDNRRTELLTEQTVLEKKQQGMAQGIKLLEHTAQSITPFLPPVLMSSWHEVQGDTSSESNGTSHQSNATHSQRLQQGLAKLTKLAEFDQRISTHEGTIKNALGDDVLVQQLFLGAGTAWFVSRDGMQAGWGNSSVGGWDWNFNESISADNIKTAIAMFEKRRTADWITLPIYLKNYDVSEGINNKKKQGHHDDKNTNSGAL